MSEFQPATTVPLDQPLPGATFPQAIARFFRKYATFSGRASRSEFWFATLFLFLVNVLIWVPGIVIGAATGTQTISPTTGQPTTTPGPAFLIFVGLGVLVFFGTLVPHLALTVRRLHDANFSGLLALLYLVPQIGGLIVLVFMFLPPNPLGARFDLGAQYHPGYPGQPYPGQPYPPQGYPPQAQQPSVPPAPPAP